ncbi:hypothetical protein HJG54_26955 [Leptolyngbya sp. NK1-12]|uniref:Uncharacterized protein n=1 Tax=Leptolyngbya sp. NK1-12 TaxID=2547451 RepID=A0AA96WHD5_9CYAN|nr:hypothetical protein [Leptolyngbya sp. NK1-12]WNZ26107.1 hypothetical protein HJG54_26955 [Leptolyngbya sp. NK1-12]
MNATVNVDTQKFFNDFATTFDLSEVEMRLQQQGWQPAQVIQAIQRCQQFLALSLAYPHLSMVPDRQTDAVIHMLDEMTPHQDLLQIGEVQFVHSPGLGTRGVEDRQQWQFKFQRTRRLYAAHFGPSTNPTTNPQMSLQAACCYIIDVKSSDSIAVGYDDDLIAMCELMASEPSSKTALAAGCEIFPASCEILELRL